MPLSRHSSNFKKCAVFALGNNLNFGDDILGESSKWIVENVGANFCARRYELTPRFGDGNLIDDCLVAASGILTIILCFIIRRRKGRMFDFVQSVKYRIRCSHYFRNALRDSDAVIIACGMFNYSVQTHMYPEEIIVCQARKRHIPVLLSAMSVENVVERNSVYERLVRICNDPAVTMFTSRDGANGVERIKSQYLKQKNLCVDFVGDPGLWSPDVYGVNRDAAHQCVGIGLLGARNFATYGDSSSDSKLKAALIDLMDGLDANGIDWVLFSNGMSGDEEYGRELLRISGRPTSKLLPRTSSSADFVRMVAGFSCVFGLRLHACIVAHSLGVPLVGVVWDDKLKFFSETMGLAEMFVGGENLSGQILLDKLLYALSQKGDKRMDDTKNLYKDKTYQSIKKFLENVA